MKLLALLGAIGAFGATGFGIYFIITNLTWKGSRK